MEILGEQLVMMMQKAELTDGQKKESWEFLMTSNVCASLFFFWNKKDKMVKERFFGLSNHQGNHGEDIKEIFYYLDNTPTHSYMKMVYKYPQNAFPYEDLIKTNAERSNKETEYEIIDTGILTKMNILIFL